MGYFKLNSLKRKKIECWEIKTLYVGVISRILAHHQVMLFNFYSFIQRYLVPSQRDVTKLLMYAAQVKILIDPI